METTVDNLNRAHKLLMDRDRMSTQQAAMCFESFRVTLVCGEAIASSPTLQAAVLTAANVATRVRPGSVTVVMPASHRNPDLLVPWPASTFFDAVDDVAPKSIVKLLAADAENVLRFGNRSDCDHGLSVTFDGWTAAVGPIGQLRPLPERDLCVTAGVAAGALGVSEIFMSVMGIRIDATARTLGLSLWRPDLPWQSDEAVGPAVSYLPNEFWSLGLGHLGQAYLWNLGLLPYAHADRVNILLQDFDRSSQVNLGTCALMQAEDIGYHKTRRCRRWLEARGFRPSVVERPFDESTKCRTWEPALALCGFDGKGPRHLLEEAGFERVVECGLGGRFDNFDTVLLHSLPREDVRAADFWRPRNGETVDPIIQSLIDENPNYKSANEACGHVQLDRASRSVAVPFVGAIAGSLVVAETLRMAHGGEAFNKIDIRLSAPTAASTVRSAASYSQQRNKLDFQAVMSGRRLKAGAVTLGGGSPVPITSA